MVPIFLAIALVFRAASLQVSSEEDMASRVGVSEVSKSMNGYFQLLSERDGARMGYDPSDPSATLAYFKDHNGVQCDLCGKPLPERLAPGTVYKEFRTDCGKTKASNAFDFLKVFDKFVTLDSLNKPGTNAWCELNIQKSCSDAIANGDYMYYAKSVRDLERSPAKNYDFMYCKLNGWLEKEAVDMAHAKDFEGMQKYAQGLCTTKYEKYNWRQMTLGHFKRVYGFSFNIRKRPTLWEAEDLAGWNCAMGDAACDMAYCAYTYCDLGDNKTRLYDECPGWDPIKGNRP